MSEAEVLQEILRDARNLTAEIDLIRAEVDELKADLEHGQREITEAKGEIKNQLQHTEAALAKAIEGFNADDELLQAAHEHVEQILGQMKDTAHELAAVIDAADEHVKEVAEAMATTLQAASELATQVATAVKEGAEEAESQAHDALNEMNSQFTEHTRSSIDQLEGALSTAKVELNRAVAEANQDVSQFRETMETFLDKMVVQEHEAIAEKFGEELGQFGFDGVEHVWRDFRRDTKARIEDEVKRVIDELLSFVLQGIDEIERQMMEAMHANSAESKLLEPIYQQIDRLIAPIEGTMDGVKSICSTVGISV